MIAKSYRSEKALRKNKKSKVESSDTLGDKAFYPILAFNAVQLEDRNARVMHGVDVSNWISRRGYLGKPSSLGTNAWISDSSSNVETHIMMMDVAVFKSISDLYFIVDSVNPEQLTVPLICKLRSLAVIRHNEVATFLDFVVNPTFLQASYYSKFLNPSQMTYMLLRNYELVAERRNPKYAYDEFHALEKVGIKMPQQYGTGFVARNFRPHWVPNLLGRATTDPFVIRFLNASMKLAGYSFKRMNPSNGFASYFAQDCYPHNVPMLLSKSPSGDLVAGQFNYSGTNYYLVSNFPYRVPFPKDSIAGRTVDVPIVPGAFVKTLTSSITNLFDDLKVLVPRSQLLKSPKCLVN
jgi:hypothetical protein